VLLTDGYSTVIADVGSNQERQIELVDGLMARRVDGLVLATVSRSDPVVEHCIDRELPVVLVNRTEAEPRLSAVVSDDGAGMRLAVEHLAELGHRRIGHRDMGEQAARMLLEEISGSHAPQRTVTLAPQLVLRASTRRA
jgi:LacI family transcriptional regulator